MSRCSVMRDEVFRRNGVSGEDEVGHVAVAGNDLQAGDDIGVSDDVSDAGGAVLLQPRNIVDVGVGGGGGHGAWLGCACRRSRGRDKTARLWFCGTYSFHGETGRGADHALPSMETRIGVGLDCGTVDGGGSRV
jgi:hypothetical protein